MRSICAILLLCAAVTTDVALADQVIFKNGDKLTGTIGSLDSGKLTIVTKVAGEVKVNLADVQTFSSDGPVEIHLKDGTVIHQKIANGDPGSVAVVAGGALQPQQVSLAQVDTINPPPVKWTGSFSSGGLITRGNSNTEALNLSLDAVRRGVDDRITVGAGYLYGRQQDTSTGNKSTTTDSWFVEAKYDYFFTKKFYAYADARFARDRIADLNIRFTPGVGVGYQWVESEKINFNTEGGLSWFYEDFSNDGTNDHVALRLAYHFDYKFNDAVKVFNNFEIYPSLENLSQFFLTTEAGVRASFTKTMFGEFKFQFNHDSEPAPDARENDLRYILGVGWTF